MKLTKAAFLFGAALLAGAPLATAPAPAAAQGAESIYIPLFTYRTGAYSGSGIPIANGMRDYLTLLNERDGGIGGVKLVIEECETSYDAKKGLECYEAVRPKNPVMINPWSTGTTLPLIPRAGVDKIPVLSMAYGLSSSAKGDTFPWIFNPPATYWDGFTQILSYIAEQEGGLDKLKGMKIGYLFLDSGFGREPLPLIEKLTKELGVDVKLYPVAGADMQNQSSQWLSVRRDRPKYMIMYGWGAMNPTAINEAARTGFPMDKFISIWWPSDEDAAGVGAGATGFKTLNWHAVGADFPLHKDIITHVVDKGLSSVSGPDKVGQVLYNRGIYNSMLIAEAIRKAQEITGKKVVTGEDVRRGLENLNVDEARLAEIGLEGFTTPVKLTCADHNGHFSTFVQQWNGTTYERISEEIPPLKEYVMPLLEEDAKAFATRNAPWPERTEPCDN